MDKKFSSILDELNDYVPNRGRECFIENRVQQIIASVNNIRSLITETYDAETAEDLLKRLNNSLNAGNDKKIVRKLKELRESRGGKK